ncbi:MAG: DNA-binding protein [Promethearchaeota archaeon]
MIKKRENDEVSTLSDDDSELAIIRRKKMAELMAREKQMQAKKEQAEKTDVERAKLLKRFLAPDAQSYIDALKKSEPAVGRRVEDVILYLIVYRGLRQVISQLDIRYVERQVKGEPTKIRVQRDGETSDFGAYVREAIKESNDKSKKD